MELFDNCSCLSADVNLNLDPSKNRLDKFSIKCLHAQNGVRMKSWRLLKVGVVLLSKSSLPQSPMLLILSIIPKQNKSARITIV
jgi:hypothetical protein